MRNFFADYFLLSAFSQEPDKTKWTAEESNLRRAGLQPAALPSELTVQIRRYKIALPSFFLLIFYVFFSIRVPVPSASARKILTRLRLKHHPGCLFRNKRKTACLDIFPANGLSIVKSIIYNAIPAYNQNFNTSTVAYSTRIFVLHNH